MSSEGETLDVLNEKSRKIRLSHCASRHDGATAQAEPSRIMDDQWLIDNRWIIPRRRSGLTALPSIVCRNAEELDRAS